MSAPSMEMFKRFTNSMAAFEQHLINLIECERQMTFAHRTRFTKLDHIYNIHYKFRYLENMARGDTEVVEIQRHNLILATVSVNKLIDEIAEWHRKSVEEGNFVSQALNDIKAVEEQVGSAERGLYYDMGKTENMMKSLDWQKDSREKIERAGDEVMKKVLAYPNFYEENGKLVYAYDSANNDTTQG